MKVAKSNFPAESFDHLRFMIYTNRKITLVDLPLTSAAIQGHLLLAHYFTNVSLKNLYTTKSTFQLFNFCLHEMLKKLIIKCVCKKVCGNR